MASRILGKDVVGGMKMTVGFHDGEKFVFLEGVTEVQFSREVPQTLIEPYDLTRFDGFEMKATLVNVSPEFIRMLLGVQEFTARQCVDLAERIAFGPWAVRCAERLVQKL